MTAARDMGLMTQTRDMVTTKLDRDMAGTQMKVKDMSQQAVLVLQSFKCRSLCSVKSSLAILACPNEV